LNQFCYLFDSKNLHSFFSFTHGLCFAIATATPTITVVSLLLVLPGSPYFCVVFFRLPEPGQPADAVMRYLLPFNHGVERFIPRYWDTLLMSQSSSIGVCPLSSQEVARRDHPAQDARDGPARPFIQFLSIVAGKLYPEQVVLSQPYDAQFRHTHLIRRIDVQKIAGKRIQGLHKPNCVQRVGKHRISPMGQILKTVAELHDSHTIRILGCKYFYPVTDGDAQSAFQGNRPFYFLDGSFKPRIAVEQIVKALHG
jgi:hypothetical protein